MSGLSGNNVRRQDHGLLGVMRTQKDVYVLIKHYRLDKVISYECSLIAKMDSVHRRRFTEKVENESFSRFSLPSVIDYRQMVDVLSGTADKKHQNFYYIKEKLSLLQVAGLKTQESHKSKPPTPSTSPCLIVVLLENESQ